MGKLILGIFLTVVVLLLAARPHRRPHDDHAPRGSSPVPASDENLIAGMKIYTMNCALCHGDLDRKPSALEHSLYPPPPNLISDPDTDPEWHIFYIVKNGIRYTGMPAWDKALPESDIWKVTAFLSRIEKLPPAVQEYWKNATSGGPVVSAPSPLNDEHKEH